MQMTAPTEPRARVNDHRAAAAQAALQVRQMEFDRSKPAEHRALLFPVHFGAPHVAAIASAADAFSLRFVPGRES